MLRAGDRAPDAPGLVNISAESETTCFLSIYKPTHLLTSAPKAKASAHGACPAQDYAASDIVALKATGVDAVVVDSEGHTYTYSPPYQQIYSGFQRFYDACWKLGGHLHPSVRNSPDGMLTLLNFFALRKAATPQHQPREVKG